MEVTLWALLTLNFGSLWVVLILIILEVTLWVQKVYNKRYYRQCLNPYYIGSYSMSILARDWAVEKGIVLILIILEVTLWVFRTCSILLLKEVLILIILEVTLWGFWESCQPCCHQCLNPYYIGSYSMRPILILLFTIQVCLNPYYIGSYSMSYTY